MIVWDWLDWWDTPVRSFAMVLYLGIHNSIKLLYKGRYLTREIKDILDKETVLGIGCEHMSLSGKPHFEPRRSHVPKRIPVEYTNSDPQQIIITVGK